MAAPIDPLLYRKMQEINEGNTRRMEDSMYSIGYQHGASGHESNPEPLTPEYRMGYQDGVGDRELAFLKNNPTLKSEWEDPNSHLKEWESWQRERTGWKWKVIPSTKGPA